MNSDKIEMIPVIITEPICETKAIILNDTVTIQNELKKLTPLERIQILNKIIKEEEAEEIIKIQNQKQEQVNKCEESNMSRNGCKMVINSKAIVNELHNLRLQMQDLQNEVKFMNRNQTALNSQMKQIYKNDEYCSDEGCSILSFIGDWMPFWIFISFVIFAFIGKPSRMCSISGNSGVSGVCPISGMGGLGGFSDFVTKM